MRALLALLLVSAHGATDENRERARALLDEAAELAGAASLEVHVMALQRLGEAYREFDREKAAGWLRQAFAATAALPEGARGGAQTRVVKAMAAVDAGAAAELLRGMAEPAADSEESPSAAERVVDVLIGKKEFDRAVEVLNLIPESAAYPFGAAQNLFEKLPEGDSRRTILFGAAHAAYRRNARGAFPELLARHWRSLPRPMAQAALESVVNALEESAERTQRSETLETETKTVRLDSRQSAEFFRLAAALRELSPKTLEELAAARPDLRAALKQFPDGRGSVNWTGSSTASAGADGASFSNSASGGEDSVAGMSMIFSLCAPGRDMQKFHKEWSDARRQANAAAALAGENPRKALDAARRITVEALRAEVAAHIAATAAARDEAAGRDAVYAGMSILSGIGVPEDRVMGFVALAEAAHKLKDAKTSWEALEKAVADAAAILSHDTAAREPNRAPRAYWPSIAACRLALMRGAKLFGARAATLLAGIDDKDLALLGRLDLAAGLLGHEDTSMRVLVSR